MLHPLGSNDRFFLATPLLLVSEDSSVGESVAGSVAGLQISESNNTCLYFLLEIFNSFEILTSVKGFQHLSILDF